MRYKSIKLFSAFCKKYYLSKAFSLKFRLIARKLTTKLITEEIIYGCKNRRKLERTITQ